MYYCKDPTYVNMFSKVTNRICINIYTENIADTLFLNTNPHAELIEILNVSTISCNQIESCYRGQVCKLE